MERKPIYTLEKPIIPSYRDYVKLYFNLSKGSNILIIVLTSLLLVGNIAFSIIDPTIYNILVYIFVGILIILIGLTIFLIPALQKRNIKKSGVTDLVDFYDDSLVVRYRKNDKENSYTFEYDKLKKKKQNKRTYLLFQGKNGIVLSKDNPYPENIKNQLDNLFVKTKK